MQFLLMSVPVPSVKYSEMLGNIAEVLQTLIPSDSCLFLPLIDLGIFGNLWDTMGISFRTLEELRAAMHHSTNQSCQSNTSTNSGNKI